MIALPRMHHFLLVYILDLWECVNVTKIIPPSQMKQHLCERNQFKNQNNSYRLRPVVDNGAINPQNNPAWNCYWFPFYWWLHSVSDLASPFYCEPKIRVVVYNLMCQLDKVIGYPNVLLMIIVHVSTRLTETSAWVFH